MAKPRWREGDAVRIIVPKFVVRVGYPKSIDDYVKSVEAKMAAQVDELLYQATGRKKEERPTFKQVVEALGGPFKQVVEALGGPFKTGTPPARCREKIVRELAYVMAKADGFGGRERSIHVVEIPELVGATAIIDRLRSVHTGTYYPPRGGYDHWTGEYDYEPGGLMDDKQHRVAALRHVIRAPGTPHPPSQLTDASEWRPQEIEVAHLEKLTSL